MRDAHFGTTGRRPKRITKIAFHTWLVLGIASASVLLTSRAMAGVSFSATAPMPGSPPSTTGLFLAVDSTWVGGPGYRPVTFGITAAKASNEDRVVKIRLQPNSWARPLEMVTEIVLPAGSLTARKTVPAPQIVQQWNAMSWETEVDGRQVAELGMSGFGLVAGRSLEMVGPSVLFVGSSEPDISGLIDSFPGTDYAIQLSGARTVGQVVLPSAMASCMSLPVADLPTHWISYTSLDLIVIPLAELTQLTSKNADAWKAIKAWQRAGGNLCIPGAGDQWQDLAEIERLLGLSTGRASGPSGNSNQAGWTRPRSDLAGPLRMSGPSQLDPNMAGSGLVDPGVQPNPTVPAPSALPESADPFLLREVGLGWIVVLRDPAASPNRENWAWLLNCLSEKRWHWAERHGMSFQADNPDFWNFLMPDVGLPPVNAFQLLITVFVIGIGPANYVLLRRWKRLNLLLFTVPVSALVITAALIGYALASDGFTTRVRARSFTSLDQKTGAAASWSRLSYYSALVPRGGLRFSLDTAIFPLEATPAYFRYQQRTERTVEIGDDQRLVSGWMQSRTPTQIIAVRSCPTKRGLEISESSQGLKIHNQIGARIHHLLIAGASGPALYVADIAEDDSVLLARTAVALPAQTATMRKQFSDNRPSAPVDFNPQGENLFGLRRRYHGAMPVVQDQSRLERAMYDAQRAVGSALAKRPRSYIAIVDRWAEIPLGVEGAQENASFHVIEGTW